MLYRERAGLLDATLNDYGDRLVPANPDGYGGEISSQREDALDRMALDYAATATAWSDNRPAVAYDIGCGQGAMAMKFASIGCDVVACDIEPMPHLVAFANKASVKSAVAAPPARNTVTGQSLLMVVADARQVDWRGFPPPDLVYSQRFLHYLRFPEAVALIRALTGRSPRCNLYLSMSGWHSELGVGYPDALLERRFDYLADAMARKHGIAQKVCLYALEDAERLAAECGLEIIRLWQSKFGNVKLAARGMTDQRTHGTPPGVSRLLTTSSINAKTTITPQEVRLR